MLSLKFNTDNEERWPKVSAAQIGTACMHGLCSSPLLSVTYPVLAFMCQDPMELICNSSSSLAKSTSTALTGSGSNSHDFPMTFETTQIHGNASWAVPGNLILRPSG